MDIRQIEFFVVLAEELNFTRAAERSHVSQPGLSSSIRSLERELRCELFDRSPRLVELTPAGRAFLPRARSVLADVRAAQRELAAEVPVVGGTLAIGAEQCLGDAADLPDLLAAFRHRNPGVVVRFAQLGGREIVELIRRDDLDAGLVAVQADQSLGDDGRLRSFEVARDAFEVLVAPEHPLATTLATTDAVDPSLLAGRPFVDFGTSWTARRILDDAFARRRLARHTVCEVDDTHLLLDLVGQGLGAAVVPASYAAKPQAEALVRRPVADPALSWVVYYVTTTRPTQPALLFGELLLAADSVAALRVDLGEEQQAV